MKIKEIHNCSSISLKENRIDILEELTNNTTDIFVCRRFFSSKEISKLLDLSQKTENYYTVYDGFKAFPRPFDHIPKSSDLTYELECEEFEQNFQTSDVINTIKQKLQLLSFNYNLVFNDAKNETNFSKTWSSFRRLDIGKGYFEVHCGRLFQEWNDTFFAHFKKTADINTQFAFLVLLHRPETSCDIEIFDAHWKDFNQKEESKILKHKNGELVHLKDLSSEKIQLFEGDILIFDEGNYWHLVPPFYGSQNRISFGGFITKMLHTNEFLIWS
jgi:hypothetical protein